MDIATSLVVYLCTRIYPHLTVTRDRLVRVKDSIRSKVPTLESWRNESKMIMSDSSL